MSNNKAARDHMFKQMNAKKKISSVQKAKNVIDIAGKKPVTAQEFYSVQRTNTVRLDSSLMGLAAIVEILVENNLCTYENFREKQKEMTGRLLSIRQFMEEAHATLGAKASSEDIGAYTYEKCIEAGMDRGLLVHVFGVSPTKSRILKPSQVKSNIIISK